jgi:SOS response regulatory protein OraA/RecX
VSKTSAYTYALKLLAGRDYSKHRIREKLERRFADVADAPDGLIEETIRRLEGEHFLNDRRFAENFIEIHIDRGRPRLEAELTRAGVDPDLVIAMLDLQDWPSLADALQAKMKGLRFEAPLDLRDAARLSRALLRLGYDEDEVGSEVERYL